MRTCSRRYPSRSLSLSLLSGGGLFLLLRHGVLHSTLITAYIYGSVGRKEKSKATAVVVVCSSSSDLKAVTSAPAESTCVKSQEKIRSVLPSFDVIGFSSSRL